MTYGSCIHDELSVRVPFGDPEQPVGDEPPAGVGTGEISRWVRSVRIEHRGSARWVESWYVAGALGHVGA